MSTTPPAAPIPTLQEARSRARDTACPSCQKRGTRKAFEVSNGGPNHGRLFLKCAGCGHFEWATPAAAAVAPTDPELAAAQAAAGPCPQCGRRRDALRVSKEGPNKGRVFLRCEDRTCDSFFWATPPSPTATRPAPAAPPLRPSTEQGFLADIRERPDDDVPRLIYADWLDDHGQAERAELIRAQCALARPLENAARLPALRRREQELLEEHGVEWSAALAGSADALEFRRGLLEHASMSAGQFAAEGERWFASGTLRSLTASVTGWQDVRVLSRCAHLRQVRHLTLAGEPVHSAGMRILAESPNVANLTSLGMAGHGMGRPGVQALAASNYLGNLRALDLRDNNLGAGAVTSLVNASVLSGLVTLQLGQNACQESDLRALANSSRLTAVTDLRLEETPLTVDGLESIAGSPLVARLRSLSLRGADLRVTLIRALCRLEWAQLSELSLDLCSVRADGLRALTNARSLAGLTRLSLQGNRLNSESLRLLAEAPYLGRLAWLDLSNNPNLPADALESLAGDEALPGLRVLDLSNCGVDREDVIQRLSERITVLL